MRYCHCDLESNGWDRLRDFLSVTHSLTHALTDSLTHSLTHSRREVVCENGEKAFAADCIFAFSGRIFAETNATMLLPGLGLNLFG